MTHISYEVHGQGEPLLLLSGQGQDCSMWNRVLPCLAQHFQVIRFDYRGTGESDKPLEPAYTTRLFAQDAIQVLDALAIQKAHIFGYSMGGRVAQWLAIGYPERVKSLIMGATTIGKRGIPRETEAQQWLMSGNVERVTTLQYSPAFASAHPELLVPSKTLPRFRQLHFKASEAHDSLDELHKIQVPTLILHGSDDRINPTANAYLMAQHIPQAKVKIIQGGRHGLIDEYAEEVCRLVSDFIGI